MLHPHSVSCGWQSSSSRHAARARWRPLRPFSLTVQAYLAHLRDAGFTGAPLPLGVDEQGREVLSFVPGDVPVNPLPAETAGDEVLVSRCASGASE